MTDVTLPDDYFDSPIQTVVLGPQAKRYERYAANFSEWLVPKASDEVDRKYPNLSIFLTDRLDQAGLNSLLEYASAKESLNHNLIVVVEDVDELSAEFRASIIESGAVKSFFGDKWVDSLQSFVKEFSYEVQKIGSLASYKSLFQISLLEGSSEQKANCAEKLLALPRAYSKNVLIHHHVHLAEGRVHDAICDLKVILSRDPKDFHAAMRLAELLMMTHKTYDALEVLKRLNRFSKLNPKRLVMLADIYLGCFVAEKAFTLYKEAMELSAGQNRQARFGLAKVSFMAGEYDKVRVFLNSESLPRSMVVFLNRLGVRYGMQKKLDKAVVAFHTARQGGASGDVIGDILGFNVVLASLLRERWNDAGKALKSLKLGKNSPLPAKSVAFLHTYYEAVRTKNLAKKKELDHGLKASVRFLRFK